MNSIAIEVGLKVKIRPLFGDFVEIVEEDAAKAKSWQKLAGGRFLLRMRCSCGEEGRRKALFKSTRCTVSNGVKLISSSQKFGPEGGEDFFSRMNHCEPNTFDLPPTTDPSEKGHRCPKSVVLQKAARLITDVEWIVQQSR